MNEIEEIGRVVEDGFMQLIGAEYPPPSVMRKKLMQIEEVVDCLPTRVDVEKDVQYEHYFAKGLYGREILMQAGYIFTGLIHKKEHIAIVLSGDLFVIDEDKAERIQGPKVWVGKAGVKRVLFIYTDTRWITIFPNKDDISDPKEFLKAYATNSYEEYFNVIQEEED